MTTTQQDTTNTTDLIRFEVGETYTTGPGDYVWTYEVVRRTAKFVTLRDVLTDETVRVGVEMHYTGRCETCLPHGRYSMAAVLNADEKAAA
jgi:hypothetical protein